MEATYIGFTDFGAPRVIAGELVRVSKTRSRHNGSPEVLAIIRVNGELFHIHASEHFAIVNGSYSFAKTREWKGFDIQELDNFLLECFLDGATTVVSYRNMNLVDNRPEEEKSLHPLTEKPIPVQERFIGRLLSERLRVSMH